MKLAIRCAVAASLVMFGLRPAEAARMSVSEQAEGGGTIVNDGTGSASTSNGSALGFTDFLSVLGVSDGSIATDLAGLHVVGSITNPTDDNPDFPATSATLNVLRLIGTIDLGQPPTSTTQLCPTDLCGSVDTGAFVKVGGSLSHPTGAVVVPNVLFSLNLVGDVVSPDPLPSYVGPDNLSAQAGLQFGQTLDYQLTTAQIQFIMDRIALYNADPAFADIGVANIRLGLAAGAAGYPGHPTTSSPDQIFPERVQIDFEVQPVPEPGTLMLLGSGAAMLGLRRRRARRQ